MSWHVVQGNGLDVDFAANEMMAQIHVLCFEIGVIGFIVCQRYCALVVFKNRCRIPGLDIEYFLE